MLMASIFTSPAQSAIVYTGAASGANNALPTNATAGTLTIAKPVNTVAGQALIASIAARPHNMTVTVPTGWISMTVTNQPSGGPSTLPGGMTLLTYYHIVSPTEPSSYSWTFANTAGSGSSYGGSAVGGILAFSGIDTSSGSPNNVWSNKLTPSGLTHSTNPITPTIANTMIISSISYLSGGSFADPTGITGLTERLDQRAPAAANAIGTTLQMSTAPWPTSTSTGSSQATASNDADTGIGHLMALKASTIDPAITMTLNTTLIAGGNGSYTLTVVNNGINAEPGPITVINTLPAGLTYNPAGSGGTGWVCSSAGQVVTCTRAGSLSAGETAAPLILNVNVSANVSGTITNTATVSGTGGDGNTANNTAINTFSTNSVAANFNCVTVGAASSTGRLVTQLVNTAFDVDVVALKSDGSVETNYVTSGSKNVTLEWVDGTCSALNPPAAQTVTFTPANAGRKTISSTITNAYRNLRCRVTDANYSPSVVGCSTDNFAVRPSSFVVTSNLNADATGLSISAIPVLKAGASFSLTAESGVAGYDNVPSLDTNKIGAHGGSVRAGTLTGGFGDANPATGTATGSTFTYSEVGYFNFAANGIYDDIFTAVDSAVGDCTADFSNIAVGGKVGCKFGNTAATVYFGRFIPDHFALTQGLATPACGTDFTYFGQDGFTTSFTLTAQNLTNVTTQNYTGTFARLNLTSWNNFVFTSAGLPAGSMLSASATAPAGNWSNGAAAITAKHQVSRPTVLAGQTSAIVAATPVDADGVTLVTAQVAPGTPLRYGRINLDNAHGSELLDLAVPMLAEYYNGSSFIANAQDRCSAASLTIEDAVISDSLLVSDTCIWDDSSTSGSSRCSTAAPFGRSYQEANSLALGSFNMNLKAPGKLGALTVNADVADWLKYNWQGAGNVNPSARATFGIYKGNEKYIYFREVY